MIKLIKILICLCISNIYCQNFSGEIEYTMTIVAKHDAVNLDSIKSSKNGSMMKYIITSGLYKSTYFDEERKTYSYSYDNTSKRMYDEFIERPYITYRDSRKARFTYKDPQIFKDSITQILGMNCFMIKQNSDYGKGTIYVSDSIKVDFESFKDHKVGDWYDKLKAVDGRLTIKSIYEFEEHFEIQEAVRITPLKMNVKDFETSPGKSIVASYDALDEKATLIRPSKESIDCYKSKIRKNISNSESRKLYLTFIITKNGAIEHIQALENDHPELEKIAIDILENCGFRFTPGKINNRSVSSMVYFPIEF